MPEENNEKTDAVSMEEHNKVIGSANTAKAENEDLKKQIEELKKGKEVTEEKKEWQVEMEKRDTQIAELQKQAQEKKDTTVVAKGVVTPRTEETKEVEDIKPLLDKAIPDRERNPEQFGSRMSRYGYYNNPTSKAYSNEQLAYAISLHADVQNTDSNFLNKQTKKQKDDIILGNKIH